MPADVVDIDAPGLVREVQVFLRDEVARRLQGHESRPTQVKMAMACAAVLETGGTLIVEAGTGTGKTFGYLIPLILAGKRAIISTKTKNLQGQLANKDLVFLSSLRDVNYAVAKGRGNYLCLRRLNAFVPLGEHEVSEYESLLRWSSETLTGDLEEFATTASPIVHKVCSDGDACSRSKCRFRQDCFYYAAKLLCENARIIIVNHALLAVNSMLPRKMRVLPDADVLILDECHGLDQILSDKIGTHISRQGVDNLLNSFLQKDEKGVYSGLLAETRQLITSIEAVKGEMADFWDSLAKEQEDRTIVGATFSQKEVMLHLAESLKHLQYDIRSSIHGLFREDEEIELNAMVAKLAFLVGEMEAFAMGAKGHVRWAEIEKRRCALRMAPLYPREFIRNNILADYRSAIMTSATLSVDGDFSLIEKIMGLKHAKTLWLPSPYDIRNQISLVVKHDIDLRNVDDGANKLALTLLEAAQKKDGGILILFTSKSVMTKVWDLASDQLCVMGYNPMMQGRLANGIMLERMRSGTNSVIFGLDSFWEGVDIKGDALKCLIITKLPFEVPTHPTALARADEIREAGGNPFADYALPKAIMKFRQGIGRLIRSKSDTGRLIICDDRIETKSYGRMFLKSIY